MLTERRGLQPASRGRSSVASCTDQQLKTCCSLRLLWYVSSLLQLIETGLAAGRHCHFLWLITRVSGRVIPLPGSSGHHAASHMSRRWQRPGPAVWLTDSAQLTVTRLRQKLPPLPPRGASPTFIVPFAPLSSSFAYLLLPFFLSLHLSPASYHRRHLLPFNQPPPSPPSLTFLPRLHLFSGKKKRKKEGQE